MPEIEATRDISHLIHFALKSSAVQKIENRLAADYLNRCQCISPLNEYVLNLRSVSGHLVERYPVSEIFNKNYLKPPREPQGYQRYHTSGRGTIAIQIKRENNVG